MRCRSGRAIPVFAIAAHAAILALMPTLEIIATQSWLISGSGSEAKIIGEFGGADQFHNAMFNRQTTLRNHFRWTRNLLLPRLLSGQIDLSDAKRAA